MRGWTLRKVVGLVLPFAGVVLVFVAINAVVFAVLFPILNP